MLEAGVDRGILFTNLQERRTNGCRGGVEFTATDRGSWMVPLWCIAFVVSSANGIYRNGSAETVSIVNDDPLSLSIEFLVRVSAIV